MSNFEVHAVAVAGYPLYHCACGAVGRGDFRKIEFGGALPTQAELTPHAAPAHAMPVGWSSYGNRVFKCPRCAT